MLINLKNSLTNQQGIVQSYLAGTITTGGTSSPVRNIAGFNASWAVQFGQTGEATSEIMVISGSPGGTVLNFGTSSSNPAGTFLFNHAQDTPVFQIHYDQIILYRSTTGTNGAFSALGTYNITPDNAYTQINDATGASGYAYYAQYYNSVTGDQSGTSSSFVPGGPTYYSLQKLRSRVKDKLYSAGYIKNDSVITDWINEAYELLNNAAIKVNENYGLGSQTFGFGTNGIGTLTDNVYKQLVKLEVTWDGQNFFRSTQTDFSDFSERDYFDMYNPQHAWRGDMVFEVLPHFTGGSVNAYYGVRFTPLVNDTDEPTQTLKAYSTAFVEYALAQAYGVDQKQDYDKHIGIYNQLKQDFITEITPRDVSSVKMIHVIQNPSGLQEDLAEDMGGIW